MVSTSSGFNAWKAFRIVTLTEEALDGIVCYNYHIIAAITMFIYRGPPGCQEIYLHCLESPAATGKQLYHPHFIGEGTELQSDTADIRGQWLPQ